MRLELSFAGSWHCTGNIAFCSFRTASDSRLHRERKDSGSNPTTIENLRQKAIAGGTNAEDRLSSVKAANCGFCTATWREGGRVSVPSFWFDRQAWEPPTTQKASEIQKSDPIIRIIIDSLQQWTDFHREMHWLKKHGNKEKGWLKRIEMVDRGFCGCVWRRLNRDHLMVTSCSTTQRPTILDISTYSSAITSERPVTIMCLLGGRAVLELGVQSPERTVPSGVATYCLWWHDTSKAVVNTRKNVFWIAISSCGEKKDGSWCFNLRGNWYKREVFDKFTPWVIQPPGNINRNFGLSWIFISQILQVPLI